MSLTLLPAEINIADVNQELSSKHAMERVCWGLEVFGEKVVLSTSFGAQSAVMLHLVTELAPNIPVVFVDTGYLFPETYQFADALSTRLKLNLKVYNPAMTAARAEALYGKLWEQGKEGLTKYGIINKVEPMNRAIRELGAQAWFAGLRRSQATSRAQLEVVARQNKIFKLHPIIDWTDRDIYQYLTKHNLPYHPMWDKGYVSIGDWHSTSPLGEGMTEEQTRFNGLKRECGLHEISGKADFQI
ncbi:MAG: phosphoadenylyl-sulfate reductase [Verrucomicrobiota bacterium]|nr:phosphoadenylyl-sulfate reductase [Verrucomicrobiota bacterium]